MRFVLLLLLASPVWGQGVSDRPTGLDRLPPGYELGSGQSGTPHGSGLDPAKLQEYLAAVEAVDLAADYQTGGNARRALNVDRIHIQASWDRSTRGRPIGNAGPNDTPVLSSLRITPMADWAAPIKNLPAGPGRHVVSIPGVGRVVASSVKHRSDGYVELEVPGQNYLIDPRGRYKRGRRWKGRTQRIGNKINEVTINRQGHLHIDVDGMPDVKVKKVTRDRNGDLRLHVGGILPDITIDKRTGKASMSFGLFGSKDLGNLKMLTEFERWPPSLQDLANMKFDSNDQSSTAFDGTVSYTLRARGRAGRSVDVAGLRGEFGEVNLTGVARIDADGFRILGDRSTLDLELSVGGPLNLDQLQAANASGTLRLQGRYGLRLPKNGGQMDLEVEGRVVFDVAGNTIKIRLPNGPQLDAAQARANGGAGFAFTSGANGNRLTVRDGVYRMRLDGPVKVKKLDAGRVQINGVDLDGHVESSGRVGLDASGLQVDADLHAEGDITNQSGLARVLSKDVEVEARPTAGHVEVDFEELEITSPLRGREATRIRSKGSAGGSDMVLEDLEVDAPAGTGTAERVRLDFTLGVETEDGSIKSGTGSATAVLEGEGQVSGTAVSQAESEQRFAVVNVNEDGRLNFRDAPNTQTGLILGQLGRGDRVKVVGDRGVWREVELRDGRTGFVHGRYLTETVREGRAASSADWAVTLAEGSSAKVEIEDSWTDGTTSEVRGKVSTSLKLKSSQIKSGNGLEMKILGAAQAQLNDVAFRWQGGTANPLRLPERVEVPFEVALEPGSKIVSTSTEIVIDQEGSRIVGKAIVVAGAEGMKLDSIEDVDARIVSSGVTRFGGRIVELNGVKTLIAKGRMVLKSNGMDIYGEVGLTVRGDERTPVISVNW